MCLKWLGLSNLLMLWDSFKLLVGECFVLGWSIFLKIYGWNRSENVGLSNENIGENLMFWKFKGFFIRFVFGGLVRF